MKNEMILRYCGCRLWRGVCCRLVNSSNSHIFLFYYTLTPLFETLLAMAHAILFEDIFELKQLNPDGKKFERGKDGKLSP
jgi:hypothetical protein